MQPDPEIVRRNVAAALAEDVGSGDVTASLIDAGATAAARVVVREAAVLCGRAWFDAVFAALGRSVVVRWQAGDGARMTPDTTVCTLTGPARTLLTGERTALNFLQTLSGTATTTARYAAALADFRTRLLDTRKTLPGLRHAQKYAVACGGGVNHRMGLYDAILIKENHIAGAGDVTVAVARARAANPRLPVEVEVETLAQLDAALDTGVERLLLDNFDTATLRAATARRDAHRHNRTELEASGGIGYDELEGIAATGVDYISIGALTKHVSAIDYSMRFDAG